MKDKVGAHDDGLRLEAKGTKVQMMMACVRKRAKQCVCYR